ncbi:AraC family transcriptional regulator [Gemmobacter aquaticus]|uniref:AraC family transcriptional regulator n=1 Tax=Gemmobacter aquaticus TaxID=490185 RepID=A0A917YNP5_9RHOB|nr:AraC family transcriptional regulator [Gemmobacter aquaticus]GGO38509.1 AraC family transcriptional regulator [Gemmobacter aquaticus]
MTNANLPAARQRAASLLLLPDLLDDFGTNLAAVLDGTGIKADDIRPDTFVPYSAFLSVLDNASRLTGREDFGILLGKCQTLAALGPLGVVLRRASTLGDAIGDFAAFQSRNSTGGAVYLMRSDRDVILGYGVYDHSARVSPQIYDLVLAVGSNLVAELTGGAVKPEEIFVTRSAPVDPTPYHRLGRCPVRFGQIQTGLVLRSASLDLPLPEADPILHDLALTRLLEAAEGHPLSLADHVRHMLRPAMLMGRAGMTTVADRLGLHPRTLRRRLRDEGTTFEVIKDDVRKAAAKDLLRLGDLSIADIAATLDYATASAFVNAFRRWLGTTPGLWRAAVRLNEA